MNSVRSTGRLNTNWFVCCIFTIDTQQQATKTNSESQSNSLSLSQMIWKYTRIQLISVGFFVCYINVALFLFVFINKRKKTVNNHYIIWIWDWLQIDDMAHSMDLHITRHTHAILFCNGKKPSKPYISCQQSNLSSAYTGTLSSGLAPWYEIDRIPLNCFACMSCMNKHNTFSISYNVKSVPLIRLFTTAQICIWVEWPIEACVFYVSGIDDPSEPDCSIFLHVHTSKENRLIETDSSLFFCLILIFVAQSNHLLDSNYYCFSYLSFWNIWRRNRTRSRSSECKSNVLYLIKVKVYSLFND